MDVIKYFNDLKKIIFELFTNEFLSKLSKVIIDYLNLFINPVESIKIAYSDKSESINFITLHLVYFCLFLFLLTDDKVLILQLLFVELLFTLIPFTYLILPYKLFDRIFKLNKNSINLFKVLIILKIQFNTIYLLFILTYKLLKSELVFLLIGNLIPLFLVVILVIIPLISKINLLKKLVWILTNYLVLLIFIFSFEFISSKHLNDETILDDVYNKMSPIGEFMFYRKNAFNYELLDKYHMVVIEYTDNYETVNMESQFLTTKMFQSLLNHQTNYLNKNNNESVLFDLKLKSLDSIKYVNKTKFYDDLKNYKIAKDSSTFESNKKYFSLLYDFYVFYEEKHTNNEYMFDNINNLKPVVILKLDDYQKGILIYKLYSKDNFLNYDEILEMENKIYKNSDLSSIVSELLFYPLFILYTDEL